MAKNLQRTSDDVVQVIFQVKLSSIEDVLGHMNDLVGWCTTYQLPIPELLDINECTSSSSMKRGNPDESLQLMTASLNDAVLLILQAELSSNGNLLGYLKSIMDWCKSNDIPVAEFLDIYESSESTLSSSMVMSGHSSDITIDDDDMEGLAIFSLKRI